MQTQTVSFQVPTQYIHEFKNIEMKNMENRIFIDTNIALDELFRDRLNSKFTNALIDKYLDNNTKLVAKDYNIEFKEK